MDGTSKLIRALTSTHLLIIAGFMLSGIMFLSWLGTPMRLSAIGQPLPVIDLKPLVFTNEQVLVEDLQGKVLVLHFWGTWCPPCMLEFPEFAKVANRFADTADVKILSVACSSGPENNLAALATQTEAYLSKVAPNMATFSDPAAMTRHQIGLLLPQQSLGYPTTVLVDRNGKIAAVWEGYAPGGMRELEQAINKVL